MQLIGSIIVAVIAGGFGLLGSIVSSRSTRSALLTQLQMQQALQNERQRVTDDKIDRLSERMDAQAAFGTEIAILKAQQAQMRGELDRMKGGTT